METKYPFIIDNTEMGAGNREKCNIEDAQYKWEDKIEMSTEIKHLNNIVKTYYYCEVKSTCCVQKHY